MLRPRTPQREGSHPALKDATAIALAGDALAEALRKGDRGRALKLTWELRELILHAHAVIVNFAQREYDGRRSR